MYTIIYLFHANKDKRTGSLFSGMLGDSCLISFVDIDLLLGPDALCFLSRSLKFVPIPTYVSVDFPVVDKMTQH